MFILSTFVSQALSFFCWHLSPKLCGSFIYICTFVHIISLDLSLSLFICVLCTPNSSYLFSLIHITWAVHFFVFLTWHSDLFIFWGVNICDTGCILFSILIIWSWLFSHDMTLKLCVWVSLYIILKICACFLYLLSSATMELICSTHHFHGGGNIK